MFNQIVSATSWHWACFVLKLKYLFITLNVLLLINVELIIFLCGRISSFSLNQSKPLVSPSVDGNDDDEIYPGDGDDGGIPTSSVAHHHAQVILFCCTSIISTQT